MDEFKILIVDDDKSNLDILNHILKQDYKIFIAKSGKSAIQSAMENLPDLILLDILMPDMSGFEVLSVLKNTNLTARIPVIIITGLTSVENEERGLFLGAMDYITKPFNNSIVRMRVKMHLQIVKQIRTIEELAKVDALTEIPNRRGFDERIAAEWGRAARECEPLSLLAIDVDDFKQYNDNYGHPKGDILLQVLAKTLSGSLKRSIDFTARVGGEEFSVLLPNTDLNGALAVAEALRLAAENIKITDQNTGKTLSITISIGVKTIIPTVDDSIENFINETDRNLYQAKNEGKNKVVG